MRCGLFFAATVLLLAAPGCSDNKERSRISGTWYQGAHTLTLAPDGAYSSVFPGVPKGGSTVFKGKWNLKPGILVLTGLHNNSTPIPDQQFKIIKLDRHNLVLEAGGQGMALSR